jgi:hypothetical protein
MDPRPPEHLVSGYGSRMGARATILFIACNNECSQQSTLIRLANLILVICELWSQMWVQLQLFSWLSWLCHGNRMFCTSVDFETSTVCRTSHYSRSVPLTKSHSVYVWWLPTIHLSSCLGTIGKSTNSHCRHLQSCSLLKTNNILTTTDTTVFRNNLQCNNSYELVFASETERVNSLLHISLYFGILWNFIFTC